MKTNKQIKNAFYVSLIVANLMFCFRLADVVRAQAIVDSGTQQTQGAASDPVKPDAPTSTPAAADVPQTLTSGYVQLPPEAPAAPQPNVDNADRSTFKGPRTFIISAYYSPLPGQNKYVTGSYNGDIRLNGGGVHGADGSNVYPGMIAAPKGYPFGTKMKIDGLGVVAVHDRGGAIVHSGERGNSYDRLDVWMGYGDVGLSRALHWGRRTLDAYVYGVDPSITEQIALDGYSVTEKNVSNNLPVTDSTSSSATQDAAFLSETLSLGSQGDGVAKIQKILQDLKYYSGKVNSVFDEETLKAVMKFQVDQNIINDSTDFGAGYVGPKTAKFLADKSVPVSSNSATETASQVDYFSQDLKPGDSGEDVNKLQQELAKINLLGIDSTGTYGEVTQHAVFKFQQSQSLVGDESSQGAGVFGPKTRSVLNSIVNQRLQTEQLIANKKPEEN